LQALAWAAAFASPATVQAQSSKEPFDQWVAAFRPRAIARGVSDATYTRVMHGLKPDTTVFEQLRNQPEFSEQLWQYLNRRGWDTPEEMNGSWAGAMGHTQWMPEVWLYMGFDYDGDWRVTPFGMPDDALGSTARYLVQRGKYRRGEHWGFEVRLPAAGSGAG